MSEEKNTNQRDTQFAGFAKLLYEEIELLYGNDAIGCDAFGESMCLHLARCAYDFACHVATQTMCAT